MSTLGLLHPGEMGSSVGAAARTAGARVLWASAGRSEQTRKRAKEGGLEEVNDLAALAGESEMVLSICPPHAACDVAAAVARTGFRGLYVDANAVSPARAREIGKTIEGAGGSFVDGGIIGPPARRAGTTRLYLSGPESERVARTFDTSPLSAIALDAPAGAASALKMCFAAYTKGSTALLSAIRALAVHEGVDDALVAEWQQSLPDLPGRSEGGARSSARKAWRFVAEMEEIASTFADAGLPDGFHRAAAEIYDRLAAYKDSDPPSLEEVARTLLDPQPDRS